MLGCFYTLVDGRTEFKPAGGVVQEPIKDVMHRRMAGTGPHRRSGPKWLPAANSLQRRTTAGLDRTRLRHHTLRPPRAGSKSAWNPLDGNEMAETLARTRGLATDAPSIRQRIGSGPPPPPGCRGAPSPPKSSSTWL